MSATPPSTERPPLQTSFRRSFTVPARQLSFHEKAGLDKTDANAEVFYSHPNARVIKFSPPTDSIKSTSKADIPADTDYPIDTVETLPWRSRTETLIATGLLVIEKVRGSTNFLKCQDVMHAILRNSQCWCVNGDSKFVLRVRAFQYYRIELPSTTDEDKEKVAELKKVFPTILRYERTPCPFIRAFTVDLPDDAITPRRKGQWKRRDSSQPNTPDTETPMSSRQRLERSWSSRVPPTSYPKSGPGSVADDERRGFGSSSRLERRGSHLDNVRNSSPASFGRSEDGTDSDHQGSEHDSEVGSTTDRSATSSPRKHFEQIKQDDKSLSQSNNTTVARDFFRRLTSSEGKPTSRTEALSDVVANHVEPTYARTVPKEDGDDQQWKATTEPLVLQEISSPHTSIDAGKRTEGYHYEMVTELSAHDQNPVRTVTEPESHHIPSPDMSNTQQVNDNTMHDAERAGRRGSDNASLPLNSNDKANPEHEPLADIIVSDDNLNTHDSVIQMTDGVKKSIHPMETDVSPSRPGLQEVLKAEPPIEIPSESTARSTSEVSQDAELSHISAVRPFPPALDTILSATLEEESRAHSPSTTESSIESEEVMEPMPRISVVGNDATLDTGPQAPDVELLTESAAHPVPLHTSLDTEELEGELEETLSPVSSIDSFHTMASATHRLSITSDSDPEDTPVMDRRVPFSRLVPRHTRDRSDVTVTAFSESEPVSPESHQNTLQASDQTPTLLRSSASDVSWPEPSTPLATIKDSGGIRQRFKARQRSFSPLPPASTIFTGDRIRHDSGSGHMTKTILQKIVIKPIEVAILVVHILTRIAGGATVNDLLSGDLFKRPEHQMTISGFADQLNVGKTSSDTEDDYGIPIRGRRGSSERRMAVLVDDETDDGFEDID